MSHVDLQRIISAVRAFLGTFKRHVSMSGAPGYDIHVGLIPLSVAAARVNEAIGNRGVGDFEAENFCGILRTNVPPLWGGENNEAAVRAVEQAVAALEEIQAQRQSEFSSGTQETKATTKKSKPIGRGGKRLSVLSRIEGLVSLGQWGWTKPRIARSIPCGPRTVQSLTRNDPEIKAAWEQYESEGNRRPQPKSKRRKPQMRSNDAK